MSYSIRTTLIAAFTALCLFVAPTLRAADEKVTKDSPLSKAMDDLGKAYKSLKKTVKDPSKNEETLKTLATAQQAALTSKMYAPTMIEKAPAGDRAKLLVGYHKQMSVVIAELCKCEQQILDGKNEDAAETIKAMKELEDKGHEVYNP